MSRYHHNSLPAERLALFWHRLGIVISAAATFVSAAGVVWHIWAANQHKEAIQEMEDGFENFR